MSDMTRGLWLQRLWGTALVGAAGAALVVIAPGRLGLVAAAPAGLVAVLGLLATAGLTRSVAAGDEGELLLASGDRVSVPALQRSWLADRSESAVMALLVVAGMVLTFSQISGDPLAPVLQMLGLVLAAGLFLPIFALRRTVQALFAAQLALQLGDLPQARRHLDRLRRAQGETAVAAQRMEAMVRLREGDVDGGAAALERTWSGALDASAMPAVLRRVGQGDLELARRWLEGWPTPDNRYQHYLRDLVASHVALAEGRYVDAVRVALARADDLPGWYRRELQLVAGAASRAAGDESRATELLGGVEPTLEEEPWRALVHPHLWRAAGLIPGSPAPSRPQTGTSDALSDPFAAPMAAPRPATTRRRYEGMLPVDWVPLLPARRRSAVAMLVLLVLLVGLLALLAPIVGLLWMAGDDDELLLPIVVLALGTLMVAAVLPRLAFALLGARGAAVVRSDGALVALDRFGVWRAATTAPQLVSAALILVLPPLMELSLIGTGWSLLASAPVATLLLWAMYNRNRNLRLIEALHVWPPDRAAALCRRLQERASFGTSLAFTGTGLGLMCLWQGRLDDADRAFRQVADLHPTASTYGAWIRAGRGEVDLDRVLAHPELPGVADAWRQAILAGVAALQADRADRVADRVEHWEALAASIPNRFGGLLQLVCSAVRDRTARPAQATLNPELLQELDGLIRAWPFLAPQASSTTGSSGSSR